MKVKIVPSTINMKGQKYGKLLVLSRTENDKFGNAQWNCLCDCGNKTIRNGSNMRKGTATSCGCHQKEQVSKISKKHGYWAHPLYKVWNGMLQRCENIKNNSYSRYGGRGIKVCEGWHIPEVFIQWGLNNGWEKGLTVERKDNDGNYCPENCVFATRETQNRNTSKVNRVQFNDTYLSTNQVADIVGVASCTAAAWYKNKGFRTIEEFIQEKNSI